METQQTLKQFVTEKKQVQAAKLLGVTQGAISQMLNSKRLIFVEENQDGSFQAFELRPVGKKETA